MRAVWLQGSVFKAEDVCNVTLTASAAYWSSIITVSWFFWCTYNKTRSPCPYAPIGKHRQTDGQRQGQTHRQTNRQTDKTELSSCLSSRLPHLVLTPLFGYSWSAAGYHRCSLPVCVQTWSELFTTNKIGYLQYRRVSVAVVCLFVPLVSLHGSTHSSFF